MVRWSVATETRTLFEWVAMNRSHPTWLTLAVGAISIVLTLLADRISVASSISSLQEREFAIERRQSSDEDWQRAVMDKLESNGRLLQRVIDRQDEVRRKLGIR